MVGIVLVAVVAVGLLASGRGGNDRDEVAAPRSSGVPSTSIVPPGSTPPTTVPVGPRGPRGFDGPPPDRVLPPPDQASPFRPPPWAGGPAQPFGPPPTSTFRVSSATAALFGPEAGYYFTVWSRDGTAVDRSANVPSDVPPPAPADRDTLPHFRTRGTLREAIHCSGLGDCALAG